LPTGNLGLAPEQVVGDKELAEGRDKENDPANFHVCTKKGKSRE